MILSNAIITPVDNAITASTKLDCHQIRPTHPINYLPYPLHPSILPISIQPPIIPLITGMVSSPICTHCASTKSPLWRRGAQSEILCNACGLYWKHHGTYRPLNFRPSFEGADEAGDFNLRRASGSNLSKRDRRLTRLKNVLSSKEFENINATPSLNNSKKRLINNGEEQGKGKNGGKMKGSAGKITIPSMFLQSKSTPGRMRAEPIFPPELPPTSGSHNTRLVPASVKMTIEEENGYDEGEEEDDEIFSNNMLLPSKRHYEPVKYIIHRKNILFIGDHVAVKGRDEQIYFAILLDFWFSPKGEKLIKLQWLLPKVQFALEIDGPPERIDPSYFNLGPLHSSVESINVIVDVFYSPQRRQRPLEGPTNTPSTNYLNLPPVNHTNNEVTSPMNRHSVIDLSTSGVNSNDIFYAQTYSFMTTPEKKQKSHYSRLREFASDSEVELHSGKDWLLPPNSRRPLSPLPTVTSPGSQSNKSNTGNILDDVEMAHFLCSLL